MATIKGTNGPDIYELKANDTYEALDGDDIVTIKARWGVVQGGQGNDTLIVDPSLPPLEAVVFYWSSPAPITVDLEAGYALDGFGTRDTLVNVRNVHGFKRPGDKGFGSSSSDNFFLSPWSGRQVGKVELDGRGGQDSVDLYVNETDERAGQLVLKGSADARYVKAFFSSMPSFTFELRNIELIRVHVGPSRTEIASVSIAGFETAGQDVLLRGHTGWQTQGIGSPVTITYGFLTQRPLEGAEGGSGFGLYSPEQQRTIRGVFDRLQTETGVVFKEVAAAQADIRFGINQQTATRGYSFIPDQHRGAAQAGDVWLDVESVALMNPGQEGYYALLHEIGHALGLQHPLGESDTSGAVVLLDRFATLAHTVMLDRSSGETGGAWPTWFGAFDLQAFRYLFGGRTVSAGDDRYLSSNLVRKGYTVILDDGGEDTIDASDAPLGAIIDLRPGGLNSIGLSPMGDPLRQNVALGTDTRIEEAIGSPFDDLITGSDGPNRLHGNGGSDLIDGLGGIDWAVFKGARAAWLVESMPGGTSWFASSRDGTSGMAEMRQIERIRFDDKVVATDLSPGGNAGKALLLIGAVLGREATLAKAELMGQVISLFDQGFAMVQLAGALMRLPIWGGVLTPSDRPEDIARYLLRVNKGVDPTAAEVSEGAQALSQQVQGQFLATLAMTEANVGRIDLVGLAKTGFEYPYSG